jgi:hypothetical protein
MGSVAQVFGFVAQSIAIDVGRDDLIGKTIMSRDLEITCGTFDSE